MFPLLALPLAIANFAQVYLNIVLDEALEEKAGGEKVRIGMVVIRGNAVVMLEVRSLESFKRFEQKLIVHRHSTASTRMSLRSDGKRCAQPIRIRDPTVYRTTASAADWHIGRFWALQGAPAFKARTLHG